MRSRRLFAVAVLALVAALASLPLAWAIQWLACESGPSLACDRKELADAQLAVAVAGLAPLLLLAWASWRGQRYAWIWLAVAALTYLAWALLADAAVHGWDDLRFFPDLAQVAAPPAIAATMRTSASSVTALPSPPRSRTSVPST